MTRAKSPVFLESDSQSLIISQTTSGSVVLAEGDEHAALTQSNLFFICRPGKSCLHFNAWHSNLSWFSSQRSSIHFFWSVNPVLLKLSNSLHVLNIVHLKLSACFSLSQNFWILFLIQFFAVLKSTSLQKIVILVRTSWKLIYYIVINSPNTRSSYFTLTKTLVSIDMFRFPSFINTNCLNLSYPLNIKDLNMLLMIWDEYLVNQFELISHFGLTQSQRALTRFPEGSFLQNLTNFPFRQSHGDAADIHFLAVFKSLNVLFASQLTITAIVVKKKRNAIFLGVMTLKLTRNISENKLRYWCERLLSVLLNSQ